MQEQEYGQHRALMHDTRPAHDPCPSTPPAEPPMQLPLPQLGSQSATTSSTLGLNPKPLEVLADLVWPPAPKP